MFAATGRENGESLSSVGGLQCPKLNQKLSDHLLVVAGCSWGRVPPRSRALDVRTLVWYSPWIDRKESLDSHRRRQC